MHKRNFFDLLSSTLRRRVPALLLVFLLPGAACLAASPEPDIRRDATVAAIEKVMPCVVNIATETVVEYHDWYDEILRRFYGSRNLPTQQQKSMSLGSGVIIDEEGYVLTNFHVVRRATRIQVKLWDGREYEAEPIVATTGSDVALLKIKARPGERFRAIKLAPDDDLLLGETVIALGNPFGLGGSVTKGILSSKNRRPSTGDEPLNVEDWLQTDAAINPGNSGGPLVNLRGELIGLNVAVYREQERGERGVGVSFSIPVKQVSAAISRFFTPEVTAAAWFGAQFKAGVESLLITTVQPGSPAARAGLAVGDQVLQVNSQRPTSLIACNRLLSDSVAQPVALLVNRGGDRRTLRVRLQPFAQIVSQKLGIAISEITRQTADRLGVRVGAGLLVDQVEKGSPAERAEIKPGYILTALDNQATTDLRSIAEPLFGKQKGDSVHLTVIVPRRYMNGSVELRQGTVDLPIR